MNSYASSQLAGTSAARNTAANETVFALHQVIDRQHQNVVACVFDYPANWQARSEVTWNFQEMSVPARCHAQAFDPQSAAVFEFLPGEAFSWVEPNYGLYAQGQNLYGRITMPPMAATDALTRWIVPKFRGNRPGLRILRAMPAQIGQRMELNLHGMPAEEAMVTLEYVENGRALEEEIYGVKVLQNVPYYGPQGMTMQINWGFTRLFSFRAAKGQLDGLREAFWHIAGSVRLNPAWEQLHAQICGQLAAQFEQYIQMGYSQIQAAGQISRAISANNDAMLAGFAHQRQAAQHSHAAQTSGRSSNDKFSDYIRGVETVNDPYWGESQQDANYDYHWTDGQGGYQDSNDPFFNPGIGSNRDWTLMQSKR